MVDLRRMMIAKAAASGYDASIRLTFLPTFGVFPP
jgi:hypothetical protein